MPRPPWFAPALLAFVTGPGATAPPPAHPVHAELQALEKNGFSGVVLWMAKGEVVLERGYGPADRESRRPMTPETVFDIGSITKPITASAVWKLEAEGRLSTSDAISQFFRGVPPDKSGITIQHLLTHTSGLDDLFGGDYDLATREWVLEKALTSKLLFAPGEKTKYSNSAYSLLAMIVEDLSGQPYERYVHENLFKPAGTPRIGYRIPRWSPTELAVGYEKGKRWGSPLDHAWAEDGPSWNLRGNGGMLSTARDLHRLMEALQKGPVLPEPARARFRERYARVPKEGGPRRIRVIGGNGIFNADYIRWVDEDVTLILMTNTAAFEAEEITPRLMERIVPAVRSGVRGPG